MIPSESISRGRYQKGAGRSSSSRGLSYKFRYCSIYEYPDEGSKELLRKTRLARQKIYRLKSATFLSRLVMEHSTFSDFASFGPSFSSVNDDDMAQMSFKDAMDPFTPDFGFFNEGAVSLEQNDFAEEEPSLMPAVSSLDEDDCQLNEAEPSLIARFPEPSKSQGKRRAPCRETESSSTAEDSDVSKSRRIERSGPDNYQVDGQEVPRLQLGESGRAQLKSSISSVLKRRPDLRSVCNSIEKVKNASITQLLTMARICGIWNEAVKISEGFLRKYPCKKAVSMADRQITRIGEMALTSIL